MTREQLLADLAGKFAAKRETFIAEVRSEIDQYIRNQKSGCLTLIEEGTDGRRIWTIRPTLDYVSRLAAFCRGKPHQGNALDSALTEPVVALVTRKFEVLYADGSSDISAGVMQFIVEDATLSRGMASALLDSAGMAGSALRDRAATFLIDQIRHLLHTTAGQSLVTLTGKTVVAAISKPVGTQLALLILKALSLHLKVIIAKLLTTAALKGAIAIAVKKFLAVAVAGAVVKAIAVKFGISAMGAFAVVLIPLVIGYIAYEAFTFPGHLAEKVSAKVAEELSGKFNEMNRDILAQVIDQILATGVAVMVQPIAASDEVQAALGELFTSR